MKTWPTGKVSPDKIHSIFSFIILTGIICLLPSRTGGQTIAEIETGRIKLPNGWSLAPVGKSLPLGDLPLNMAVSPSAKLLAVTNNGYSDQSIQLIDTDKQTVIDSLPVGKAWIGLVFSSDNKLLYASGGNDNWILRIKLDKNRLTPLDTLFIGKPWPEKIAPAGMALDDERKLLYVVTTENN
jgi:WD40 repeat protein